MRRGHAEAYRVFVRDWWIRDDSSTFYNEGVPVRPYPGAPRRTIAVFCTLDEARDIAQDWNDNHDPGPLWRKAEFESMQGV